MAKSHSRKAIAKRAKEPELRPDPPGVVKLPPLLTAIYRNGKLERISEQRDPRELFCACFNDQGGQWEMSAKAIVSMEVADA